MTDAELTEACEQAGLLLRGVERRGALLVLKPLSLDGLPTPATLRTLAAELQERAGARWVTLEIEGAS